MEGDDAHHVAAEAEEGGVAEADQGAVADQQVEAGGGHAVDGQAGEQADQEGFVQQRREQRQQGEGGQAGQVDDDATGHGILLRHARAAGHADEPAGPGP
ncbi:hypothetical protein D3C75_893300 [compost metagenome]